MTAAAYLAALTQNAEDFCANRIDYDAFSSRAFALWREIEQRPRIKARVLAAWRNANPCR